MSDEQRRQVQGHDDSERHSDRESRGAGDRHREGGRLVQGAQRGDSDRRREGAGRGAGGREDFAPTMELEQQPRVRRISGFVTIWLLAVWLLLFGQITPLIVVGGLIVVLGVQALFPMPHTDFFRHVRPWPTIILAAHFLRDMVAAALHVSKIVLSGRPYECAVVGVDLRSDSEIILAITATMTNLIPGTIVVEILRDETVLYLHVLDVEGQRGAQAVRQSVLAQEVRALRAFCTREELDNLEVEL